MKKKLLWCAGIVVLVAVIILGVWHYIALRNRQTDLNWKFAEQIFSIGNAFKGVDENYECKSISKVTPYIYADSAGNTITYYCCQTTYISDEYEEDTGLNTDAIGMVIDFAETENKRHCKVNGYDAFLCEIEERSYLCWTISPKISCVIEYSADTIDEADAFRMAESVQLLD